MRCHLTYITLFLSHDLPGTHDNVAVLTSFCAPTCILKDELSVLAKTIMNSLDTTYFKRMHLLFSDYSSF